MSGERDSLGLGKRLPVDAELISTGLLHNSFHSSSKARGLVVLLSALSVSLCLITAWLAKGYQNQLMHRRRITTILSLKELQEETPYS